MRDARASWARMNDPFDSLDGNRCPRPTDPRDVVEGATKASVVAAPVEVTPHYLPKRESPEMLPLGAAGAFWVFGACGVIGAAEPPPAVGRCDAPCVAPGPPPRDCC